MEYRKQIQEKNLWLEHTVRGHQNTGHEKMLGWNLMQLSCHFSSGSFLMTLCILSQMMLASETIPRNAMDYESMMKTTVCTEQDRDLDKCCPARLHTCCFDNIFSFISNSIFNCLSRKAAFFMIVAIVISFWWSSSVRSEISFLILSCSEPWHSSSWESWLLICGRYVPVNINRSFCL